MDGGAPCYTMMLQRRDRDLTRKSDQKPLFGSSIGFRRRTRSDAYRLRGAFSAESAGAEPGVVQREEDVET